MDGGATSIGGPMKRQPLSAYSRRIGLFTALASVTLVTPSLAQSVWSGSTDNEFSTGTNWTPSPPGENDTAEVDTGSPIVTDNATVGKLDIDGGNVTISNTGSLTVKNGTTIQSGSLGINADGVMNSNVELNDGSLFIDGTLNGKLTLNKGNVSVNGALGSAAVGDTTALTNNGTVGDVSVSSGGTFTNNNGASAGTLTNAGTASNAGTLDALNNTAGTFTNDGEITGNVRATGGTVTNNFVITDADVAAAAIFINNSNGIAGNVRNAGTASNAGSIASLRNDAGSFTNNNDGEVTGRTTVTGGGVTNNGTLNDVVVGSGGVFTNASNATAGAVTNAGNASNAGTIASLTNTAGSFTNNTDGEITGQTRITGGTVTNNFIITDADVAAAAAFVNNTNAQAGAIRNSGSVTNAGTIASVRNDAGTFTNNSGGQVTGTTSVNGGTVINNATLADVNIAAQGTFTNNNSGRTGAVVNAGIASNDGIVAGLANSGGTFTNTGEIAGAVQITGGALVNHGTVDGTIDVFDGGLLSGTGIVGGITVNSGGVLSPGPGIATLTVGGDLRFGTGSFYDVDIIGAGSADRVDVAGALTIDGGTVRLNNAGGTYGLTNRYTILTADTVTGRFGAIESDFAFLSPTLVYGAKQVNVDLDRNDVRFSDVAQTGNDRATAAAVEALGASNPLFLSVLPLDVTTAADAFAQLNGEVHASLQSQFLLESRFPREAVLDRAGLLISDRHMPDDGVSFWSSGALAANHFSADGNARGMDSRFAGGIVGGDLAIADDWRLGGLVGYSHLSVQPQADADTYHVGVYAAGSVGPVNLTGGAIYSRNAISTRRTIAFSNFEDRVEADYNSDSLQAFAEMSADLDLTAIRLQPFANLAYVNLDTDAFGETGGAAALTAGSGSSDLVISTIGARFSADLPAYDIPVTLTGTLGWQHAAGDLSPSATFAFSGGSPFILKGVSLPRDAAVVKAGVTARLSKSARLTLGYSGAFANGLHSHTAQANLLVNF